MDLEGTLKRIEKTYNSPLNAAFNSSVKETVEYNSRGGVPPI